MNVVLLALLDHLVISAQRDPKDLEDHKDLRVRMGTQVIGDLGQMG